MAPAPSASAHSADVTIAFAGDVHFAERTATLLNRDPSTAVGPISHVLSQADIAMANLETAVTTRGTPEPKQFHFRAPLTTFDAIRSSGIDVVSLANNHTLDYGQTGLFDTIDAARTAQVPIVGVGSNANEAYAPWTTTVRGVRIAFFAVNQVHELESRWAAQSNRPGIAMAADGTAAAAAVRKAKQEGSVTVVYAHWGQEGNSCPTGEQKTFAKKMADAGADIVVGTHSHLLLGAGWLGRTYVAYGLGNFLWWWDDAFSNDTGVLKVTLRSGAIVTTEFIPAVISRTTGQPLVATNQEATRLREKFNQLRQCTGLLASPAPSPSTVAQTGKTHGQ